MSEVRASSNWQPQRPMGYGGGEEALARVHELEARLAASQPGNEQVREWASRLIAEAAGQSHRAEQAEALLAECEQVGLRRGQEIDALRSHIGDARLHIDRARAHAGEPGALMPVHRATHVRQNLRFAKDLLAQD